MVYFLLLLSFFLHLYIFIQMKQLKDKNTKLQQVEENVNEQVRKLEDTLAVYLLEMKQENDMLIRQLEKQSIEKNENSENKKNSNKGEKVVKQERPEDNSPFSYSPIDNASEVTDTVESSLTSQVLHLKGRGYTIEKIAKELDKRKTEIELLLKFYQKK